MEADAMRYWNEILFEILRLDPGCNKSNIYSSHTVVTFR